MQPSMLFVRNRIGRLGEAKTTVTLRLLVKDFKDRGYSGIKYHIVRKGLGEMGIFGVTNGNGTAVVTFETEEPSFTVKVELPEGVSAQDVTVREAEKDVIMFRSVQAAPQPLLTPMEMVAGGSGLALIVVGLLTNVTLVERLGETVVMATAFYRVGRAVM